MKKYRRKLTNTLKRCVEVKIKKIKKETKRIKIRRNKLNSVLITMLLNQARENGMISKAERPLQLWANLQKQKLN